MTKKHNNVQSPPLVIGTGHAANFRCLIFFRFFFFSFLSGLKARKRNFLTDIKIATTMVYFWNASQNEMMHNKKQVTAAEFTFLARLFAHWEED